MSKPTPGRAAASISEEIALESVEMDRILTALQELVEHQVQLGTQVASVQSQNLFLSQQITQMASTVSQQVDALSSGEEALHAELRRFQTGGPQHAMAAIFYKLFRDLLGHINQLDLLAQLGRQVTERNEAERRWIEAICVLQEGMEATLSAWGCAPIQIVEGISAFDPECHEAIPGGGDELPPGMPEGVIVRIQRRGWKLHGAIIQFPQVIVS